MSTHKLRQSAAAVIVLLPIYSIIWEVLFFKFNLKRIPNIIMEKNEFYEIIVTLT